MPRKKTNDRKSPPGFMLWREDALLLLTLDDDEKADVITSVLMYFLYGEEVYCSTDKAEMIASIITEKVDINSAKYRKKQENGNKAADKRWNNTPKQ